MTAVAPQKKEREVNPRNALLVATFRMHSGKLAAGIGRTLISGNPESARVYSDRRDERPCNKSTGVALRSVDSTPGMPMADTDAGSRSVSTTLLYRLRNRENEAYAQLQDLFGSTVSGRLQRMGIPPGEIDDLSQEIFVKIWKSIDAFRRDAPGQSFRRWLHTILRNVAIDYWNKTRPGRIGTDQLGQVPESLGEQDAAVELAGEVHRMLEMVRPDLTDTTYQLFVRYWFDGHDTDELAREYGMKKNAVREARRRVMHRLRETFFELYGDDEWPFARRSAMFHETGK
jgi:RNA polymerase sigma-70 factor (ECF subfamily)